MDPSSCRTTPATFGWFVRDLNGPERTITGATLIFEQPFERTFPFEMVETFRLWHVTDHDYARQWFERVQARLGAVRKRDGDKRAA